MKKTLLFAAFLAMVSVNLFAQDETEAKKEKDYPVSATFEHPELIDGVTCMIPDKKTLEFVIQHKFGSLENGSKDLWGIYGSSNIRLGLSFVPIKNFMVGAGITRSNMMTDLNAKWNVLSQTRKNTIPVSVTLYGVVGIDGRAKDRIIENTTDEVREAWTGPVGRFKFPNRLNYFSQLLVSRKFNEKLSLQAGVSFTHYNTVGIKFDHDKVGIHGGGRLKVSPQGSIIVAYDQALKIKSISEQREWYKHSLPNLAFGYEISTGNHVFQLYVSSTSQLLPQENIMWNQRDLKDFPDGFSFGFVINRLWGF
jgi:hypothetical protein